LTGPSGEPSGPSADARSADSRSVDPRPADPRPEAGPGREVRHRSWFEVRWRQFRSAPRPVVRAVASSLGVAIVLGAAYLLYDVALTRGADLPGGDLRVLALAIYVALVVGVGTVVTYLIVPQPTGSGERRTRTVWSAALGFFAAVPIAYLVLVVAAQVLKPLLV
jgi:hypothetical protein